MPFFSSRKPEDEVVEEPAPLPEEQPKRHGLFGSRRERSPSPSSTIRTNTTTNSHNSNMTGRTSSTYHTSPSASPISSHGSSIGNAVFIHNDPHLLTTVATGRKSSLLQRTFGNGNGVEMDPSIIQAREHVMNAETAEREADRALEAARLRVREAREEVKRLELEAKEDARRAKIKQYHAREVSKRGKQLGRKFRHDRVQRRSRIRDTDLQLGHDHI